MRTSHSYYEFMEQLNQAQIAKDFLLFVARSADGTAYDLDAIQRLPDLEVVNISKRAYAFYLLYNDPVENQEIH